MVRGVAFAGKVVAMLSRIRLLVGVLARVLRFGGPPKPSPRAQSTEHAMAPPQPPTELIDDATTEILLRLPPDEPAHLARASLVCKPWRRILSDPSFHRRYREFHQAPPLLGFLRNLCCTYRCHSPPLLGFLPSLCRSYRCYSVPRFVPITGTSSPFSPPSFGNRKWCVLDCRHGRVLIKTNWPISVTIVWDPITGGQQQLPMATYPENWEPITAAVLCSMAGCDHLDCRGGPFLVVVVGNDYTDDVVWVSVYSSEAGAWGATMASIDPHSFVCKRPSLLVGGVLYFTLLGSRKILKYDLGGQGLFVIDAPGVSGGIVMAAKDGELGFANVAGHSLYLWSWQPGVEGIAGWAQQRVIELDTLIPLRVPRFHVPLVTLDVVGFAEVVDTIFISTDVGLFTLELKSQQVRKVAERGAYHDIVPYTGFYTPGCNHREDAVVLQST